MPQNKPIYKPVCTGKQCEYVAFGFAFNSDCLTMQRGVFNHWMHSYKSPLKPKFQIDPLFSLSKRFISFHHHHTVRFTFKTKGSLTFPCKIARVSTQILQPSRSSWKAWWRSIRNKEKTVSVMRFSSEMMKEEKDIKAITKTWNRKI